jgi:tripartite-type tricarboxylate transporter receptor subunit TctC
VAKVNEDVVAALRVQSVREKFMALGLEPVGNSPAEAAAFLEGERGRWSKVIEKANLRID